MNKENCYELGHITKTHALKGEIVVFLDTDSPEEYIDLESVLIETKGALVPYIIESCNMQGNKAIVKLEEVDNIDQAKALVGAKLWLPLEALPALQEGQFYYHEVIGYQVVDAQKGILGIISTIYANGMQDLIAMNYQGKEVLIPLVNDIVKHANHESKQVIVTLPEGLLEIYLTE